MKMGLVKDSVRFRILIATLVPVIFVFVTITTVLYYYLGVGFDKELEQRLISVASLITTTPNIEYAADLKEGDEGLRVYDYLTQRLKYVKDIASLNSVFIFNREGRLLVSSANEKIGKRIIRLEIDRNEIEKTFNNKKTSSILFRGDDGNYYKSAYVPVIYEDGKVIAALGVSASATYFETLKNIRNGIILVVFLSLLLIIIIITVVSKSISKPVSDLIKQAKSLARGDFEQRLDTKTYGELAILVETFEQMRERIMNRDSEMKMMLSGIAHEIRNPLGGMQIMIDLVSERFTDDKETQKLIVQMNNELKYLNNVVTSFLRYSKNINVAKSKVNLVSLIDEVTDIIGREIDEKEIVLKKELIDVEVLSDYDILKQVFINILLNSIQAVERQGMIEIRDYRDENRIVVIIKDNGMGIKSEDMKMIFRPFFTTKEKGSGLGLPLVRKYLLELGGDIEIKSEYKNGCEVRIYLPVF